MPEPPPRAGFPKGNGPWAANGYSPEPPLGSPNETPNVGCTWALGLPGDDPNVR